CVATGRSKAPPARPTRSRAAAVLPNRRRQRARWRRSAAWRRPRGGARATGCRARTRRPAHGDRGPDSYHALPQRAQAALDPCLDGPQRGFQALGNLAVRETVDIGVQDAVALGDVEPVQAVLQAAHVLAQFKSVRHGGIENLAAEGVERLLVGVDL